jgi:integrase/recombinase XerD
LQLIQSGLAPGTVNGAMLGLRFIFRVMLKRPEAPDYVPMAREPRRLPVVLTQEEVARLLESERGLRWRTALSVTSPADVPEVGRLNRTMDARRRASRNRGR